MNWFDPAFLLAQVQQYGVIGVFLLLAAGIIALPVPEETLLVLAGILAVSHKMPLLPTLFACMLGSIVGITTSYALGRTVGHFAVVRIMKRLHIPAKHLDTAHHWFTRVGKWSLVIGYFIPGVRHFTGVVAGTTELEYGKFALFAYSGAVLWSNCFFWFGYHFGNQAIEMGVDLYERYGTWLLLPFIVLIPVVLLIKRKKA